MKKRLAVLAVFILCLCLLAGCECKHEWVEADCLTAKTCSKCEITEGNPLGHDFAPATCTAPEVCTRCALTQGEMLPHVYGDWTINETDMTRACENCGAMESSEIDRELAIKQLLRGTWDFVLLYQNGQQLPATYLSTGIVGPYVSFSDNLEGQYFDGEKIISFTTEFQNYEANNDYEFYYALLTFDNGDKTTIALQLGENDLLALFIGENSYFSFSKNEPVASALCSSWAASKDGTVYTLRLNEDRSFSGNLDGEITGTWHLRPATVSYGYRSCALSLRYEKDGAPVVIAGSLELGPENISVEQYLEMNPQLSFSVTCNDLYLHFIATSEDGIAKLIAAQEEGSTKPVGRWISKSIQTYNQDTASNDTVLVKEYSMTFGADGTFTAQLDQERTGTWSFRESSMSYDQITYSYTLNFDGVSDSVYANISSEGELRFGSYQAPLSQTICFISEADSAQWEQLQKEGNANILGSWNALYTNIYSNTGISSRKSALDYTITFCEDGTFTAIIDQNYTGTWEFTDTYSNNTNPDDNAAVEVTYDYVMRFDGIPNTVDVSIYSGEMNIHSYGNETSKSINLVQLSEAELANLKKGLALAEGAWKAAPENPAAAGYTMNVNADGTFSAAFGEALSGTWVLQGYTKEEGYSYIFFFGDSNDGYVFSIRNENEFEIWQKQADGQILSIIMNKA